jgi:hypothetical protein
MTFREVLRVPLWWWVIGLGVALGVAAEVHLGADGWRAVWPYVVFPLVVVAGLLALSRHRVVVEHDVLHVPGARAPLSAFGPAEVLSREDLRAWLGPGAHRDAWVRVKPWLKTAVLLPVTDPEDDTPYWLVGVRDPVSLTLAVTTVPEPPR